MLAIIGRRLIAPRFSLADDVVSRLDRESRDADFAEAEVIGAVVMALFRLRIRDNSQTHLSRDILRSRIEGGALRSVQHDVAHAAQLGDRVVMEIQRDAPRGNRRMLAQIFRTE